MWQNSASICKTEGTKSFDDSWQDLLNAIEAKSKALK